MNRPLISLTVTLLAHTLAVLGFDAAASDAARLPDPSPTNAPLSPSALAVTRDGKQLFIACATGDRVLIMDTESQALRGSIPVPGSPQGLAVSPAGRHLYVTCASPQSTICVIDIASSQVVSRMAAGHTAVAPVCSPDGKVLYVCNRFNHTVAFHDLATQRELCRVPLPREPVAAVLTRDGKFLWVANHLPHGRADQEPVSACVSIIDTEKRALIRNIALPSGSTIVREIALSPAGDLAGVVHVVAQFHLPTTHLERGWVVNNALTLIDVSGQRVIDTVLLDTIDSGAANPWALAWTADGAQLVIAHAGTHELSVIDAPGLLRKLGFGKPDAGNGKAVAGASRPAKALHDLTFLAGMRQRVPLGQQGPRALAVMGSRAYVANYFSDSLSLVELAARPGVGQTIALGPAPALSLARRGEQVFNDGSLCFQGWLSCATCHSSDARVDGLNWDLLNDGLGNPKNAKSLLWAHKTPPSMALGIRANAEAAVRAGFKYILFTVPPESTARAVDEYLESLTPMVSPYFEGGELSPGARRGKSLFMDAKVGCATCHPPGLYTDLKPYDVGTHGRYDKPRDQFFTPTLVECWRTGPYLHDGSAADMREVLTGANSRDRHGHTSHLSAEEIEDLAAFVLSL